MSYTIIGIDPAPTKASVEYDGTEWKTWAPQDLHDRVRRLKGPAILAWDAPLSFDRSNFYDRSVDRSVRKWALSMEKNGKFEKGAVNARAFAALPHWTVSCDALGMPFGQKPPGFQLAATPPSEESSSVAVIEVHPAVAIGIWWVEADPGFPLPVYKGKEKAMRAAANAIASVLKCPKNDAMDDDYLDSYVAHAIGAMFRDNKARWLGSPEKGGYVLPDTKGSPIFKDLEELYRQS